MRTPRNLFNTVATLLKPAVGLDEGGSTTLVFTASGEPFKCRIRTLSMSESRELYGENASVVVVLYCGVEVPVTVNDQIQVGGCEYSIHGVDDTDRMGVLKTVSLVDVL